ncbi:conserved membrane hypothetical protein [Gammaproteobacteria bacterium]
MFVWIFHRVSGLILILLIGFKIITGYGILGYFGNSSIAAMRDFHRAVSIDLLTVGLFIYHSLYGVRTCLIDLGLRKEKLLFWIFTLSGTLLFMGFTYWLLILGPAG